MATDATDAVPQRTCLYISELCPECLQARPCPQAPSAPSAVSGSLSVNLPPVDDPLGSVAPGLGLYERFV